MNKKNVMITIEIDFIGYNIYFMNFVFIICSKTFIFRISSYPVYTEFKNKLEPPPPTNLVVVFSGSQEVLTGSWTQHAGQLRQLSQELLDF